MIKVIGILESILTVILQLTKSKVSLILHIAQIRHMHVFNSCISILSSLLSTMLKVKKLTSFRNYSPLCVESNNLEFY